MHPGSLYSNPGAQASDGWGNALQVHSYNAGNNASCLGPNLLTEGTWHVSYAARDTLENTVNASRTGIVDDRTAPTMSTEPSWLQWASRRYRGCVT